MDTIIVTDATANQDPLPETPPTPSAEMTRIAEETGRLAERTETQSATLQEMESKVSLTLARLDSLEQSMARLADEAARVASAAASAEAEPETLPESETIVETVEMDLPTDAPETVASEPEPTRGPLYRMIFG